MTDPTFIVEIEQLKLRLSDKGERLVEMHVELDQTRRERNDARSERDEARSDRKALAFLLALASGAIMWSIAYMVGASFWGCILWGR